MFGGLHHRDEVKRERAIRLEHEKQNEVYSKVLAAQGAAALMLKCLYRNQKTLGITLDTADFVRHVSPVHVPKIGTASARLAMEQLELLCQG
jgi:hypothetical protein